MCAALALYEPDIPQNTGAAMRLCACLGATLHIVGTPAYPWREDVFRRSAMDYARHVSLIKHTSWDSFVATTPNARKILIETDGAADYGTIAYLPDDILVMGAESKGFPPALYAQCDMTATIPMVDGVRSLNVVTASAIVLGEMTRQMRLR